MNPILLALLAGGAFYSSTTAPIQYRAVLRYAAFGLGALALLQWSRRVGLLQSIGSSILGPKFEKEGLVGSIEVLALGEEATAEEGAILYERRDAPPIGAPTPGIGLGRGAPGVIAAIVDPPEDGFVVERFFGKGYKLDLVVTNNDEAALKAPSLVEILTTETSPSLIGEEDVYHARTAFETPLLGGGETWKTTVLAEQAFDNYLIPLQVVAQVFVDGRSTQSTFYYVRKIL